MDRTEYGTDLRITAASVPGMLDLASAENDLVTVSGVENLIQALSLRLMTPYGDLAQLGHPRYGCRLYLLVGRRLGPDTVALAVAYLRECLRDEPRIESILRLEVRPASLKPDTLELAAELRAAGLSAPFILASTFDLNEGRIEVKPHGV